MLTAFCSLNLASEMEVLKANGRNLREPRLRPRTSYRLRRSRPRNQKAQIAAINNYKKGWESRDRGLLCNGATLRDMKKRSSRNGMNGVHGNVARSLPRDVDPKISG